MRPIWLDRPADDRPGDFPEFAGVQEVIQSLGSSARIDTIATATAQGRDFPVQSIVLGSEDIEAPTFVLVGGIHGLERIGTQVVLSYLTTLASLLAWDDWLVRELEHVRLAFVPLVNPAGMILRRRANANGVDLMRNAPCDPLGTSSPLVGGQRWSPRLPWYMGDSTLPMEAEAAGLCRFVRENVFGAETSIVIDVHSGYGLVDRLWFPYARTRRPFADLATVRALQELIDRALPNHVYRIEPQAHTYTVQGDLWDYLYDQHRRLHPDRLFLPLTLEMGSWLWIRKNPRQLFNLLGSFNPIKPHRVRRTLRRHLMLFDVVRRACASRHNWGPRGLEAHQELQRRALARWYAT